MKRVLVLLLSVCIHSTFANEPQGLPEGLEAVSGEGKITNEHWESGPIEIRTKGGQAPGEEPFDLIAEYYRQNPFSESAMDDAWKRQRTFNWYKKNPMLPVFLARTARMIEEKKAFDESVRMQKGVLTLQGLPDYLAGPQALKQMKADYPLFHTLDGMWGNEISRKMRKAQLPRDEQQSLIKNINALVNETDKRLYGHQLDQIFTTFKKIQVSPRLIFGNQGDLPTGTNDFQDRYEKLLKAFEERQ